MLPPQRQRLLIGKQRREIDKGVVARLTRLDIATRLNEALDGGGALHKVILARPLQLEGLVGRRVKSRLHDARPS